MTAKPAQDTGAMNDSVYTPVGILLALLVAGGVCLLPLIPPVHSVLRVSPGEVAVSMGGFAVLLLVGAVIHPRRFRRPKLFDVWDRIETVLTQLSVLFLVFASDRGDSFFWLLALLHVMMVGANDRNHRFHYAIFGGLPALVGLAFLVFHDNGGAAALSVAVGGIAAYVYNISITVHGKLKVANAERARLAAELAETRVREERERIARDIHDGIGADLAAMDWRLRGLHQHAASDSLQHEVDELTDRLAHGSDELRTIVWALRTPSRSWADLVTYLRQRSTELAADRLAIELVDEGDGGVASRPGEVALEFLRMTLELVRNSVRHAKASRLKIVVRSDAKGLAATIEDDGQGLGDDVLAREEGGLANLRHRIGKATGAIAIETSRETGTKIAINLPVIVEPARATATA